MTKSTKISGTLYMILSVILINMGFVTKAYSKITYTENHLSITGAGASAKSYGVTLNQINGISFTNSNPRQDDPIIALKPSEVSNQTASNNTETSSVIPVIFDICNFAIDVRNKFPAIYGNGNRINFLNTITNEYNSLFVSHIYNVSDARVKKDVADVKDGLLSLTQLRPVTYRWASPSIADGTVAMEKLKYGSDEHELQYGFIAQEVEEIFPDMVSTDSAGNKAINYTSLIPILVKSVQELQEQISMQASVIDNLNSRVAMQSSMEILQERIISCSPNPTHGEMTISYSLLPRTTDARILVTNLVGTAVLSVECNILDTSVDLNLGGVVSGVYLATLICNGEVMDSRQIVVSH